LARSASIPRPRTAAPLDSTGHRQGKNDDTNNRQRERRDYPAPARDEGRAILFTSARTANTFSDRPVGEEQLREIYELMKWGAGLDAEFFPDGDWRSILVVNIGHPGDSPWFDRLPRLDYQETVRHA
jgi:hypothetical protein